MRLGETETNDNMEQKNEKRKLNQYSIWTIEEKGESESVKCIILLAFPVSCSNSNSKMYYNTLNPGFSVVSGKW